MDNEQIKKIIGQRVRHYRIMNSLTQRELAKKLGVNYSYIANIEQGHKGVSLEKIVQFCMWFKISVSDLLPIEPQSGTDEKECVIRNITDSLRTWETEKIKVVETMIVGTR
jgi:transcriptional regulator with XRE-family HTH domain